MIEKITHRNGKRVVEVRSDGGHLLFIKTKDGYEIKCRKTKEIYIIKYELMFVDCLRRFFSTSNDEVLFAKAKEIRHALNSFSPNERNL